MNEHLESPPNDDELRTAFEAETVEPTADHLERLRTRIASNTKPCTGQSNLVDSTDQGAYKSGRWYRVPASLTVIVALAIIAVLVARPFVKDVAAEFHSTLNATREAAWIHGSTTTRHDGKTWATESWCSPVERIVAFRSKQLLHFVDYELGLQSSYSRRQGKVFQWQANPRGEGMGREFVFALLNDQNLQASFPFHEVSDVKKSVIDVGGETGTEYSFEVQQKDDPSISWTTSVTTDPATGRIILWTDQHASGLKVSTSFDYPDSGPSDIFELGAPLETDVIEIDMPRMDLHKQEPSNSH